MELNKVELLAPAGDLERLKIAITYGADAVYIGGEIFGMRSAAKNFSKEDMAEGNSEYGNTFKYTSKYNQLSKCKLLVRAWNKKSCSGKRIIF